MKLALTMPQFGESITEALIVRWLKKEGDEVVEREPILELETEKSVFAYESPFKGKLLKILRPENQKVAVGIEIAYFEVEEKRAKNYLGLGIGKVLDGSAAQKSPEPPQLAPKKDSSPKTEMSSGSSLSPMIRALAKEKGVPIEEIEKISGTGPGGRVSKEDFLKYVESKGGRSVTPSREGVKRIDVTPIRARIAEKMLLSKKEIPHAGTGVDADVTAIEEWRSKNQNKYAALAFVLYSVIPALKKFPILNSSLKSKDGTQWIEEYTSVHLGIATATSKGLMVPVVKNADRLSFTQLVEEGTDLIKKAKEGTLSVAELTGGTFTVNNTGALGAVRSSQVIPPPQSGILAVNRVTKRPWVVQDEIKIRSILSLDLAFDHRIVDGDAACGFLMEVKDQLEQFDFSSITHP